MGILNQVAGTFAGTQYGHFFKIVPPFVDKSNPPGYSAIPKPTFGQWLGDCFQLRHIWASPNLVWSTIAVLVYFLFPYDLSSSSVAASKPLSFAFFRERFPLWAAVTFGYTAYWHVTLYYLNWAERPFIPNRKYNWDKMGHNLLYFMAGLIIWTGFENVFAFLWATGRLAYLSDDVAFSTWWGFVRWALGLVMIPLWRDVHFYFAHRLLHYKPMYQQVHSLHHRNTDIEPFSGITMHPVEHVYYYACILPSLVWFASPFHFLWNGMHLLLAPAASHSGWEDHFQADLGHYCHHRYFECNYAGGSAMCLDVYFGTFVANFKEKFAEVKNRPDAKSTLRTPPTLEFISYMVLSCACILVWSVTAVSSTRWSPPAALFFSTLCGFGPVVVACLFTVVQSGAGALLDPFSKRPWYQNFLHVFIGNLFCGVPVTWACYLAMTQP